MLPELFRAGESHDRRAVVEGVSFNRFGAQLEVCEERTRSPSAGLIHRPQILLAVADGWQEFQADGTPHVATDGKNTSAPIVHLNHYVAMSSRPFAHLTAALVQLAINRAA